MKVNLDGAVRVNTSPVDAVGGAKPEPEERPAEELRVLPIEVKLGVSAVDPNAAVIGKHDGVAVLEGTAGEFASVSARACRFCAHFNRSRWVNMKKAWEHGTPEDFDKLQQVRGALLDSGSAQLAQKSPVRGDSDDLDVEHALNLMGLCDAMTAIFQEEIVVYPTASCPEEDALGNTLPNMFRPRDRGAQRAAGAAKDEIMRAASPKEK